MSSREAQSSDATNNHLLVQHAASPTSPALPTTSHSRSSFHSHGRTLSMVAEHTHQPRSNRFSIQFPIQPTYNVPVPRSTSPVREPAAGLSRGIESTTAPADGNYLHLIAAQERRVLELKEELQRAEADLNKLKRDWARHEADKKREDTRRITKLQTLQTSLPITGQDDIDGSNAWMQQEMERRRALMSASKNSNRTVLPGQKHTRALSLLTPAKDFVPNHGSVKPQPLPPRKESLRNPVRQSLEIVPDRAKHAPLERASTMSDLPQDANNIDHEALLRAGKKVAIDFKDGLWSFWDDIRQAAVGEDAKQILPPKRKSSTQTLRTARKQGSGNSLRDSSRSSSVVGKKTSKKQALALPDLADPSFWSDHGIEKATPVPAQSKSKPSIRQKDSPERLSTASTEPWDTWDDSPKQSRSSSSVTSEATTLPSTVSGSPRQSIGTHRDSRDMSKRDSIPWPALKKTGLGTLRRTASHLLTEWERSLIPSPGKEYSGQGDYMGANAEAIAYGAGKGKSD